MITCFQVASIKTREVNTKNGLKPVWDLYDSDGTKYGMAFSNPSTKGINIGSWVTGDVTDSQYGKNIDAKTISVSTKDTSGSIPNAGTSPPQATSPYSKSAYKEKVFPVPPQHGDMAIIRQNALSNATALVSDYVATLPAEKFPDLENWSDLIINMAYKFAKFSSGHRELEAADKLVGIVPGAEISKALEKQLGTE